MSEKKYILAKLAPVLVVGGLAVFVYAFVSGIMNIGLLIRGSIAGLAGAMAMSIVMMLGDKMGMKMDVVIPQLVSSNIGLEKMWMMVHFFTGISFGLGYIIISGILGFQLSILGALVFALAGPEMFLGLVILPDNGLGMFGKNKGMMMPMMTVMMHVLFGAVMGAVLVAL